MKDSLTIKEYYNKKDCYELHKLCVDDDLEYSDKFEELKPYANILRLLIGDITQLKYLYRAVNGTIDLIYKIKDHINDLDCVLVTLAEDINPITRLDKIRTVLLPMEVIIENENYGLGYFLKNFEELLFFSAKNNINYNFNYKKFDEIFKYYRQTIYNTPYASDSIMFTILAAIYVLDKDISIIEDYLSYPDMYLDYLAVKGILEPGIITNLGNISYYSPIFKNLFYNVDIIKGKHKKEIR